ncbi:MAG TPA: bifunctional oligoribonuclease/PAP phosphatase NrnA [Patescibacteria group bacterium]|nr:bifunctional oligoribonuclease/PAP phosphatase NrnA [Patescibacteria group bacterium]
MNYKESQKILEEIKKANKILINCHRSPDPDSVGSALAMRKVLLDMGKTVEVVCPDNISVDSKFLESSDKVQRIDYDTFDFSGYDTFLLLDSSEWSQVAGLSNKIPEIKKIVIDHHYTNKGFGEINIVDSKRSSTAEVVYKIFKDWNIKISTEIAQDLLAGLIYDTSSLQHSSADITTAKTMAHLMELGADKDKIIFNFYRNISFDKVKLIGEILKNLQIDKENRFVWSAIPHETYILYPDSSGVTRMAANFYASSIENTDFGMIMVEEKKDSLNVSMRAKVGSDISKIAEELGGGGHKQAGGAMVKDVPFDEAVEKALAVARKYARKN